jgi:predicted component of type VI protein secretion system
MRDGYTRKVETPERDMKFEDFQAKWRASLVVLSGEAAGTEWEVQGPQTTIGRGDGCDWKVDDDTMSKEHATIEFSDGGLRLRDLASMNGILLNGTQVNAAELESGDRFQLGDHEFQFVLEARNKQPRTWVLPDDS